MTEEQKKIRKEARQRTLQQNKALHLFFTHLAVELNMAGLGMRKVLKPSIEIDWTAENVKNHLWRPIQKAQVQKTSTTELDKGEVSMIWETLNRHLGEKFGIHAPFPSKAQLLEAKEAEKKLYEK